jgi:hypothetical protein
MKRSFGSDVILSIKKEVERPKGAGPNVSEGGSRVTEWKEGAGYNNTKRIVVDS